MTDTASPAYHSLGVVAPDGLTPKVARRVALAAVLPLYAVTALPTVLLAAHTIGALSAAAILAVLTACATIAYARLYALLRVTSKAEVHAAIAHFGAVVWALLPTPRATLKLTVRRIIGRKLYETTSEATFGELLDMDRELKGMHDEVRAAARDARRTMREASERVREVSERRSRRR